MKALAAQRSRGVGEDGAVSWRRDLESNGKRGGWGAALVAWFIMPGFRVLMLYRTARGAHQKGGALGHVVGKLLWRWKVADSGCYLSLLSDIGEGLSLPHAVGVVIGDGVIIGSSCTIYQHVTIGRSTSSAPAYPVIGTNVTIYAGAVIAGAVKIGDGAVIGANSVVLIDVPAGATAVGSPARIVVDRRGAPKSQFD